MKRCRCCSCSPQARASSIWLAARVHTSRGVIMRIAAGEQGADDGAERTLQQVRGTGK